MVGSREGVSYVVVVSTISELAVELLSRFADTQYETATTMKTVAPVALMATPGPPPDEGLGCETVVDIVTSAGGGCGWAWAWPARGAPHAEQNRAAASSSDPQPLQ
jgi:hypothetical protein